MINIYTSSVVPVSSRVFVLQIAFRCQLSAVGARRGERALNRTLYRYPKEFIRRVERSDRVSDSIATLDREDVKVSSCARTVTCIARSLAPR
jgi:hypothetical protein